MKKLTLVEQLKSLNACPSAIRWIKRRKFKTLEQAWKACGRSDWMMWLLCWFGYSFTDKYKKLSDEILETVFNFSRRGTGNIVRKYYPKAPKMPKWVFED